MLAYYFNYVEGVDFKGVPPDLGEGPDSCICTDLCLPAAHADYSGINYVLHLEAI